MTRRLVLVLSTVLAVVASTLAVAPSADAALGLRTTPDQTWMTNGVVYASALSEDGKTLYIGGQFTQVREKPPGTSGKTFSVNRVAAIDVATGAPIRTWHPSVTNGDAATEVRALAVKNDQVYIGGTFNAVDGQPRRNLAAVDANTGALSSFAPTVGDGTSAVYTVLPSASRLFIGGKFKSVNGQGRGNLAVLNLPSGALDPTMRMRANSTVRKLTFDSTRSTIFAVGYFSSVKGTDGTTADRQSVARFDAGTGNVHPWAIPAGAVETPQTGWDVIATPTRLYVALGNKPNHADAFRLDNGNSGDRVWRFGLVGNPQSLALSPDGSRLIVGGHFGINPLDQQVCGGKYLKGLVALDRNTGLIDCSWIPSLDQKKRPSYNGAWTLQTIGNYLWVGGGFTGVSGVPQSNLARFTYDTPLKPMN